MAEPFQMSIEDIYRALKRGAGREFVTDANVDDLIAMAKQHDDKVNEFLLREWRSSCGDDPDAPNLRDVKFNHPPFVHKEEE